jgi:hypothetical protein
MSLWQKKFNKIFPIFVKNRNRYLNVIAVAALTVDY